MTDCQGTWEEVAVPDETGGLAAMACDGCGELLVIVKGRGYNFPPGFGLEDAVRSAIAQGFGPAA